MRRRLLAPLLTASALVACNAVLGLDGDTLIAGRDAAPDGSGSSADGSSADGASTTDATGVDAGPDARPVDDGEIRLVIGAPGGPGNADDTAEAARFDGIVGVARDPAGNRYVIDASGTVVRKVDRLGVVTTLAGQAGDPGSVDDMGSRARFHGLTSIASDGARTLYVTSDADCRLRSIDTVTGSVTTLVGTLGCTGSSGDGAGNAAKLLGPKGVTRAVIPDGSASRTVLYVSDPPFLKTYDLATQQVTSVCGAAGGADGPGVCTFVGIRARDLAFDGAFLHYRQDAKLYRLAVPGGAVEQISGTTPDAGGLKGADLPGSGLVVEPSSGLVLGNDRLLRYASVADTSLTTLAGNDGGVPASVDGPGDRATFESIRGLAYVSPGAYDVADITSLRVRVAEGTVSTVAGRGLAVGYLDAKGTDARIGRVVRMTQAGDGLVYFYDREHAVIRSYDPTTGSVAKVAGMVDSPGTTSGLLPVSEGFVFDGTSLILSSLKLAGVFSVKPATGEIAPLTTSFSLGPALASDQGGRVFCTSANRREVMTWSALQPEIQISLAGEDGSSGLVDGHALDARFARISGVCFDASRDELVVVDAGNYAIRTIKLAGGDVTVKTLAGVPGAPAYVDGPSVTARLADLDQITCDGKGSAYLDDATAGTIRRIDLETGTVTTVVGTRGKHGLREGALPGRLNHPRSPLALANGHLLVPSQAEAAIVDVRFPPP